MVRRTHAVERQGDSGDPEYKGRSRARCRSGKIHVITQIRPVIDAGNDTIDRRQQPAVQSHVNAISGISAYRITPLGDHPHVQIVTDGNRVRAGAPFSVGRDDIYIVRIGERSAQRFEPPGMYAVIVRKEYIHRLKSPFSIDMPPAGDNPAGTGLHYDSAVTRACNNLIFPPVYSISSRITVDISRPVRV